MAIKKNSTSILIILKFKDKIIYIVVDEQPKNILDIQKKDTKEQLGEKLILNGMARDYFQERVYQEV